MNRFGRAAACGAMILLSSMSASGQENAPTTGSEVQARDPLGTTVAPLPGQIHLSTGVRYWYSVGRTNFAFSNLLPYAGDPSSTLDWTGITAQSGEAFVNLEHAPTGLYLKGLGGGGGLTGGQLVDRDFFSGQRSFSATRSSVQGAGLSYGIIDLGLRLTPAPLTAPGLELTPFVGYHFWHESPIARGAACEPTDIANFACERSASGVLAPPSTKFIGYSVRWHALRIGLGANWPIPLAKGLSVSGEVAFVPYAQFSVNDSHYLRTDLGPPPNIFLNGTGHGAEAEVMLNYAVTDRIGLALGGRYWGLFANSSADLRFQPIATRFPVTRFDQQRYGLLVQARYRF